MRAERVIPLQDVERVRIYINKSVRALAEVKALTGADMALVGVPAPGKLNYICCVCLLRGDQPERLIYGSDLVGRSSYNITFMFCI